MFVLRVKKAQICTDLREIVPNNVFLLVKNTNLHKSEKSEKHTLLAMSAEDRKSAKSIRNGHKKWPEIWQPEKSPFLDTKNSETWFYKALVHLTGAVLTTKNSIWRVIAFTRGLGKFAKIWTIWSVKNARFEKRQVRPSPTTIIIKNK